MKGRKPTPVEQRRREGNPQHRPLPEPVHMSGKPSVVLEPPDDLPETAKQWWRQAVPILHEVGLLETVDVAALEMAAIQYARFKQAGRVLSKQGHLARGSTGQLVEHPSMATERNAANLFLRFAEQYALTPVARTRLGLAELQRRSLVDQMTEQLGKPELEKV